MPVAARMSGHRAVGEALEQVYRGAIEAHLPELAHHFLSAAPRGDADERRRLRRARRAPRARDARLRAGGRPVRARARGARAHGRRRAAPRAPAARPRHGAVARRAAPPPARPSRPRSRPRARSRPTTSSRGAALGFAPFALTPGYVDEAHVALLGEALERIGDADPALRVRLLGSLAVALYWSDNAERAPQLAREALQIARRLGDDATLAIALCSAQLATSGPDCTEQGLAWLHELFALTDRCGETVMSLAARSRHVDVLLELDDIAGADTAIETLERLAREAPRPARRGVRAAAPGAPRRPRGAPGRRQADARRGRGDRRRADRLDDPDHRRLAERRAHLAAARPARDRRHRRAPTPRARPRCRSGGRRWPPRSPMPAGARRRCWSSTGSPPTTSRRSRATTSGWRRWRCSPRRSWRSSCPSRRWRCYAKLAPFAGRNVVLPTVGFLGPVRPVAGHPRRGRGPRRRGARAARRRAHPATRDGARTSLARIRVEEAAVLLRDGGARRGRAPRSCSTRAADGVGGDRPAAPRAARRGAAGAARARRRRARRRRAWRARPAPPRLRRVGDVWTITSHGRSIHLNDGRGVRLLALLLERPGTEMHSLDLVAAVDGAAVRRARRRALRRPGDRGPLRRAGRRRARRWTPRPRTSTASAWRRSRPSWPAPRRGATRQRAEQRAPGARVRSPRAVGGGRDRRARPRDRLARRARADQRHARRPLDAQAHRRLRRAARRRARRRREDRHVLRLPARPAAPARLDRRARLSAAAAAVRARSERRALRGCTTFTHSSRPRAHGRRVTITPSSSPISSGTRPSPSRWATTSRPMSRSPSRRARERMAGAYGCDVIKKLGDAVMIHGDGRRARRRAGAAPAPRDRRRRRLPAAADGRALRAGRRARRRLVRRDGEHRRPRRRRGRRRRDPAQPARRASASRAPA